jgi:Cu-Zn family superoxide dismutase
MSSRRFSIGTARRALVLAAVLSAAGFFDRLAIAQQAVGAAPTPTKAASDIPGLAHAAAEASLAVADGVKMSGRARFEEVDSGVNVLVEVRDATPGKKAVHIHEKGDCSRIREKSMGNHFAPRGEPHGLPDAAQHHLGDLGNMEVDDSGRGRLEILAEEATLGEGDQLSFLNRAIVVHQAEDTGAQPSGGAGDPIACGVIEKK